MQNGQQQVGSLFRRKAVNRLVEVFRKILLFRFELLLDGGQFFLPRLELGLVYRAFVLFVCRDLVSVALALPDLSILGTGCFDLAVQLGFSGL
jgi:hypothetical protein